MWRRGLLEFRLRIVGKLGIACRRSAGQYGPQPACVTKNIENEVAKENPKSKQVLQDQTGRLRNRRTWAGPMEKAGARPTFQ
jgi:hypothetical protein